MGLKHIKLPSVNVEFSGGSFAVRGLCLDDIAYLVSRHGPTMKGLYDQFTTGGLNMDDVGQFIFPLLKSAPGLASEVIACGAGDANDAELAARFPIDVQTEALEAIISMTFATEGGPKKVLETVIRLAQGTTALLENLTT